ncbi:hypothetical protein BCR34DRAFT_578175 [Clohesyomyces aquaticus]|uniref:Uncharacterized protein n=1 Tax=Clohesyomyces aquaticus TaxID=1231657 RepID=A0A1Y1YGH1_9PLEO|nr:hypothetical protein BCR34DRAFT_578175 [Clohesyomyces aquaticus]
MRIIRIGIGCIVQHAIFSSGTGFRAGSIETESSQARIVHDKFLVLMLIKLSHSGEGLLLRELRGFIDGGGVRACSHVTLRWIPELWIGKASPDYLELCEKSFGSCAICLTDYCVEISRCGRKNVYFVTVSIYRQIGDCRSPSDWQWRSMATWLGKGEPRISYDTKDFGPGVTRDRWNKGEGVVSKTGGEWVEVPRTWRR